MKVPDNNVADTHCQLKTHFAKLSKKTVRFYIDNYLLTYNL